MTTVPTAPVASTASTWADGWLTGRGAGTALRERSWALALTEARPVVQAVFLLRYACAVVLATASGGALDVRRVLLGGLAVGGCIVAVYVVNGVADVVEDRANSSVRPIASGRLTVPAALWCAAAAAVVGTVSAAFLGPVAAGVAVLLLVVGCGYSVGPWPLKNTVPTFMVAVFLLGAGTYALGILAVGHASTPAIVMGVCLSAWMACGGTSKDFDDAHGDRIAGRRTWPVVLGERRARRWTAVAALGVAVAFLAGTWFTPWLLPAAVALAAGAVVLAGVLCVERVRRRIAAPPYRIFMITQYVTHLAGLGAGLL